MLFGVLPDSNIFLYKFLQSPYRKLIACDLFYQLGEFAVSLSHVVVDLLVAYGVFLAEGKGG